MADITILGSGTAVSSSYPSGYLLKHNGKNFLLDCGEGVRHRLSKAGVDYFDISGVFLSHFHPDHFNVETLIQSMQVRNYAEKTEKSLNLYGPPELGKRIKAIWEAKHFEGAFDKFLPDFLKLEISEYRDRETIDTGSFKVTPYFLAHGNMPAAALRFEIDDKILAYSGDTGVNVQIGEAAKNADLFICECNQRPAKENPGHLNPRQIGEIAKEANVKKVVLTHLPGTDEDNTLIEDVKGGGYGKEIIVGHDFDVLQLKDA